MKNKNQKFFCYILGIVMMSVFLFVCGHQALALSQAVVTAPKPGGVVLDQPLQIAGLAPLKSKVYIFVDGKMAGNVAVKKIKSRKDGLGSFTFTYKKKRLGAGTHEIQTRVVQGKTGSSYTKQTFTVPATTPRKLDGRIVKNAEWNLLPIGVMIENTPAARPQAGLSEAAVVYETLAEGGVTRFFALWPQTTRPKLVGPIRSARPYYVDWAKEYDAFVLHAGGSRDALVEFGKLFVRSYDALTKRGAPYAFRKCAGVHCLFTDTSRLTRLIANNKLNAVSATSVGWKFKDALALADRPNHKKKITIDFNGKTYKVAWQYDRKTNKYLRWNGGAVAKDRNTNKQLSATNVIVMRIAKEKVLDRQGHLSLQLVGRGNATLYRDGQAIPLRWQKKNTSSRTIYYLKSNGKEVEFNRGATWVEVVPGSRAVTYR